MSIQTPGRPLDRPDALRLRRTTVQRHQAGHARDCGAERGGARRVRPSGSVPAEMFPPKSGADAVAAARAAEADEAANKADQAKLAALTASREAARAMMPVRGKSLARPETRPVFLATATCFAPQRPGCPISPVPKSREFKDISADRRKRELRRTATNRLRVPTSSLLISL
jgi:hypothetical protein